MTRTHSRICVLPWIVGLLLVFLPGREAAAGSMFLSSVYDGGILARDIVTGHFNADEIVDLAVLSQGYTPIEAGAVRVLLGNGDGTFRALPPIILGQDTNGFLDGDLDSDGRTDLVVDMAGTAGFRVLLSNSDGTFRSAPDLSITTASARGVLADFTSDGRPDFLVVKGTTTATFEVYGGAGDGTFVAPPAPTAVPSVNGELVVGDVNLDGKADVVTGTGGTGTRVFLGNGDGTFNPILGVTGGSFKVAKMADMDRDGRPDLVIGFQFPTGGVSLYRGNGDGTFQEPPAWVEVIGNGAEDLSTGDADGDGWLDVVVTAFPLQVHTILGAIGGAVRAHEQVQLGDRPFRTVMADFDGRRGIDLALVALSSHSVFVVLADEGGVYGRARLNPVPIPLGPRSVVMADFDRDGIADLAGPRFEPDGGSTLVGVARGLGGGVYDEATFHVVGVEPHALIAADVNGDAILDLVSTNIMYFGFQSPVPGSVSVLIGVGNGDFLPERRYPSGGYYPKALGGADLDDDGDIDLVVMNHGGGASAGNLSILAGNGDGTFAIRPPFTVGTTLPSDFEIAELTGDGRLDLAVVNEGNYPTEPAELSILPGAAGLTFGPRSVVGQGLTFSSVAAGDLDGDGDTDLATADEGDMRFDGVVDFGHARVFLNNGSGGFLASQPMRAGVWSYEVKIQELNGDGIPEVLLLNVESDDVAIFPGRGDGTYGPAERYALFGHPLLLVRPFDGDPRPDLIVFTPEGVGAYLNVGPSTPQLRVGPGPGGVAWSGVPLSAGYDVVKGDLSSLRTGGFSLAILDCLQNDSLAQSLDDPVAPARGQGFFYLVRAIGPSGAPGTYDEGGPGQAAPRDAAIGSSALACP